MHPEVLEILRRVIYMDFLPLTDDDLTLNAEELFLVLDAQSPDYD